MNNSNQHPQLPPPCASRARLCARADHPHPLRSPQLRHAAPHLPNLHPHPSLRPTLHLPPYMHSCCLIAHRLLAKLQTALNPQLLSACVSSVHPCNHAHSKLPPLIAVQTYRVFALHLLRVQDMHLNCLPSTTLNRTAAVLLRQPAAAPGPIAALPLHFTCPPAAPVPPVAPGSCLSQHPQLLYHCLTCCCATATDLPPIASAPKLPTVSYDFCASALTQPFAMQAHSCRMIHMPAAASTPEQHPSLHPQLLSPCACLQLLTCPPLRPRPNCRPSSNP